MKFINHPWCRPVPSGPNREFQAGSAGHYSVFTRSDMILCLCSDTSLFISSATTRPRLIDTGFDLPVRGVAPILKTSGSSSRHSTPRVHFELQVETAAVEPVSPQFYSSFSSSPQVASDPSSSSSARSPSTYSHDGNKRGSEQLTQWNEKRKISRTGNQRKPCYDFKRLGKCSRNGCLFLHDTDPVENF